MAIQMNVAESKFGIPFNSAYFRIVGVNISRTLSPDIKFFANIDISGYAQEPTDPRTTEIDFRRLQANLNDIESLEGATFISKCYVWVMSHPDIINSGAIAI